MRSNGHKSHNMEQLRYNRYHAFQQQIIQDVVVGIDLRFVPMLAD